MTNHSFGDSHSIYTFQNIDDFAIHHLGAITMHRVGRDGLGICDIGKFGVIDRDRCFFSFGEIDVRCHIHKQVTEQGRPLAEVIATLVEQYCNTLAMNSRYDVDFWAVSVLPPPYLEKMPQHVREDKNYPFAGSNRERATYAVALNDALRHETQKRGMGYLDLHRLYQDEDGMLVPELSDGMYHVGNNYPVREELTRIGILAAERSLPCNWPSN